MKKNKNIKKVNNPIIFVKISKSKDIQKCINLFEIKKNNLEVQNLSIKKVNINVNQKSQVYEQFGFASHGDM